MGVAVVFVVAAATAHQIDAGWQQGAAQGLTGNQVAKRGDHGDQIRWRGGDQLREFGLEGGGDAMVGIEAEAPGGADQAQAAGSAS